MPSNLDHSLDEIIAARPRAARRGGKAAATATGGIRKRSQRVAAQKANASVAPNAAKAASRATPTGPSGKATKIIVSNLPFDVSEGMIKEYFQQVVGPVRRAILTYGPNGQSRGVATVEFVKSEHAQLAAQKYNGVDVDNRPMKVELVFDPSATSFADRIGAPNKVTTRPTKAEKPKPKPVAKPAARGGTRGERGNKRGGAGRSGSGRGKPKTAEQLDQDMSDYFGGDTANTSSGVAPATAATSNGGDVGMDDTVL